MEALGWAGPKRKGGREGGRGRREGGREGGREKGGEGRGEREGIFLASTEAPQFPPLGPSKQGRGHLPQGVGPLQLPKQGHSNCCQRGHKGRKERSKGGKKGGKKT